MTMKVLYALYKIVFKPNVRLEDDSKCFGSYDHELRIIKINTDYTEEHQRVALIHENNHAIDYMVGLDLSEDQIRALSNMLFESIEENPEMWDFIIKGPRK
ncbi:hypothetical protein KAR91_24590 [Candidatus Pacearchaeota archaeon]|nr:hypothetical protein [Candidatus Pacearchaeota archaeon]